MLNTLNKYRIILTMFIAAAMLVSFVTAIPRAQAQSTYAEMMQTIESLLKQIAALQAKVEQAKALEGGFDEKSLAVGDEVVTTGVLKARSEASVSDNVIAIVPAGVKGSIVGGPESHSGYTWWKINYESGATGWSVQNWLKDSSDDEDEESDSGDDDSNDGMPSCKLTIDRSTYALNDTMDFEWESENAEYLKFIPNPKSKMNLSALGETFYVYGTAKIGAVYVGEHTITFRAFSEDGKSKDCSVKFKITDKQSSVSATISSITSGENPTLKGKAAGASVVGISIGSESGDKVYGSGDIKVTNGAWSHKVSEDLAGGTYDALLYVNGNKVAQKNFTVKQAYEEEEDEDEDEDAEAEAEETDAEVYAVGVYQATGASHSFCESSWGDVTVTIASDLGDKPIILILTSYEPVRWNVKNPAGIEIEKVILAGYNTQEVSGAIGDAEVEHHTYYHKNRYTEGEQGQGVFYDKTDEWPSKIYHWASQCPASAAVPVENRRNLTGSSDYAYAYSSADKSVLNTKVKQWTGQDIASFQGSYSGTSFTISNGEVLGVSTTSVNSQLKDILLVLTDKLKQMK